MSKINKILIMLALLWGLSGGMANAQTTIASGTCGANLTWELTANGIDTTLTISGSGDMTNFGTDMFATWVPWRLYQSSINRITIGNNVTSIGSYAFNSCTNISSISIPNSITSIGASAFRDATIHSPVTIPNSVTTINQHTFCRCAVPLVILPNTLTKIELSAFAISKITSITIPENVVSIESGAFSDCDSLKTVNYNAINCTFFSNSVGFGNCSALVTLNIGSSVTSIPANAFSGCSGLTSVLLPESLLTIESAAFAENGFTEITIPENVTSIASGAFSSPNLTTVNYNAVNALKAGTASMISGGTSSVTLNIGENVKEIPDYAFYGWTALTDVNFESANNLETIGNLAFMNCTGLKTATVPNSVTSINIRVFANTGLTSATIHTGVTNIESNAFENCTNLTEVYYNAVNCDMSHQAFTGCPSLATLVIGSGITTIPAGAFQYPSLTSITIGEDVTTIDVGAFYGCGITTLTIPESVDSIGEQAFRNCTNLETLNFNAVNCTSMGSNSGPVFLGCSSLSTLNVGPGVTNIPDYAFRHCSALTDINFGLSAVSSIGDYAFANCGITSDLIIPASVHTIGQYAFYNSVLSSVTIPESVDSIGNRAFYNCTGLHTVNFNAVNCADMGRFEDCSALATLNIGENVTIIPERAFWNCASLASVDFSNAESLTTIGIGAFTGTGLTSIIIPESITKIGAGAFSSCESLVTVNYNAMNGSTGGYAVFENCPNVTQLNIGENVTIIPSYIFGSCTGLTSVVIPENVTIIKYAAFLGCTNLETLILPSTLTEIEYSAFSSCNNITEITTRSVIPPTIDNSSFPVLTSATVYIPCLTNDVYRNSRWNYLFGNFIVSGPVSDTTYYYASKCYNRTYSDDNFTDIYYTGDYYITLENQYNCDSVVCLVLSEYDYVLSYSYPASVCQGGSYSDDNFADLTTAGYHFITLQNINGCDSSVYVNLSIIPAPVYNYSATICKGSSYSDDNFSGLTTAGIYSDTLQINNGCDSIVRLQLSLIEPSEQELCMISVDMEYHNQVIWIRQDEIAAYKIYREGNIVGQYELAATIPFEETNSWIDTGSNARTRSYNYKISAIDTCGNESELSSPHKTMHLTINQGVGNSWNLIWTPYEGTGYSTYNVYRYVGNMLGELELIGTIPSSLSSFSDFVSSGDAYVYYMVEIVLDDACEVSPVASTKSAGLKSDPSLVSIRSNIATNNPDEGGPSGLKNINAESSIQVYPNPVKDMLVIDNDGLIIDNVEIIDLFGKTVLMFNDSRNQINVSALPYGVYFVRIETKNGIVVKKIIKE